MKQNNNVITKMSSRNIMENVIYFVMFIPYYNVNGEINCVRNPSVQISIKGREPAPKRAR